MTDDHVVALIAAHWLRSTGEEFQAAHSAVHVQEAADAAWRLLATVRARRAYPDPKGTP